MTKQVFGFLFYIFYSVFSFIPNLEAQNLEALRDSSYSKQETLLIQSEIRKSLGNKSNSKDVKEIVQNLKPWAMMENLPPEEFAKSVKRFVLLKDYGISFEDVEELIPYFYTKKPSEENILYISKYFKESTLAQLPEAEFTSSLNLLDKKQFKGPSILFLGRLYLLAQRFGVEKSLVAKVLLKDVPLRIDTLSEEKRGVIFDQISKSLNIPINDETTKSLRNDLVLITSKLPSKIEFIKSERRTQFTLNEMGEWESKERPKLDPSILLEKEPIQISTPNSLFSNLEVVSKTWVGVPYRYGSMSRSGTDCSGLTTKILTDPKIGYPSHKIPRSARDQASMGSKVDRKNISIGDLVFFSASPNQSKITHVGLSLKNKQFIHASTSRGVVIQSLDEKWWVERFVVAKKIFGEK